MYISDFMEILTRSPLYQASELYEQGRRDIGEYVKFRYLTAWNILKSYEPEEGSPDFEETVLLKKELRARLKRLGVQV